MKQRSDYTFKYNKNLGRHGWLRLTPAYSVKLVSEILQLNNSKLKSPNILDPFSGTATTGIVAAELGFNCTLYDINPFLVWFGKTKGRNYDLLDLNKMLESIKNDLPKIDFKKGNCWIPPMRNIERWWSDNTQNTLASIRNYLSTKWGEPNDSDSYNLLWVGFARLCIECSAADFNHISVSFKESISEFNANAIVQMFFDIIENIFESASIPISGSVNILNMDSRLLEYEEKYDIVVTSPPYPNRISYIRELRPYMYWLKFLSSGEEAGELDWKAIGGTWGIATSRLTTWEQTNADLPQELLDVYEKITVGDPKNGILMAQYVKKFFDDLYIHLGNLRQRLNKGARLYYILGNSSFYGNYVRTDVLTQEILTKLGYSKVDSVIIRKRNSKSHLYEYMISATWNG